MTILITQSLLQLFMLEPSLVIDRYEQLCEMVSRMPTRQRSRRPDLTRICIAYRYALIAYPKPVVCLQRSAALTRLLRSLGFPAEMVIGLRSLPFQTHAWVELDGAVVDDPPELQKTFHPLQRF